MRVADSVLDLIGHTPLVRLTKVTEGIEATVLAKIEYFNPGGSVKDRVAVNMIAAAEADGRLKPGGTIVEPTSGNTGVGLAIVGALRGYKVICTMPDKIAEEKRSVLRAYGAEVIVCPTAVAPSSPESYYSVAERLTAEIPGAWRPNQYANPDNPGAHVHTTAPEIWDDTDGTVTHYVAGVGTGGTISGVGSALKNLSGGTVKVIGADPVGSVYSGGDGRPYLVEGVGEDFWPPAFDRSVPDEIIAVSDKDSFTMTRRLAREEGLLVGGSCGMAVVAALEVARKAGPGAVVVVLLPDSGKGYLSKVFSDTWMERYGFLAPTSDEPTVGAVLADAMGDNRGALPEFVAVLPGQTVGDAVALLRKHGVSQLPVVAHEWPVRAAEIVGSVVEDTLLDAVFTKRATLATPVGELMGPALPMVGAGEPVSAVVATLATAPAVLVLDDGTPRGLLTRSDVLSFLAEPGRA